MILLRLSLRGFCQRPCWQQIPESGDGETQGPGRYFFVHRFVFLGGPSDTKLFPWLWDQL